VIINGARTSTLNDRKEDTWQRGLSQMPVGILLEKEDVQGVGRVRVAGWDDQVVVIQIQPTSHPGIMYAGQIDQGIWNFAMQMVVVYP